jgi:hypothetical protein
MVSDKTRQHYENYYCKDRLVSTRVGVPVSHASDLFILLVFSQPLSRLSTLVHRLPLKYRRYLRSSHTHSRPHSPPPFLFPFIFIFSLFFHTLGNDDLHLAAPVRHQYTFCSVLSSFSFIFTDIFLTIFLSIPRNDEPYTLSLTIPLAPYHRSGFLSRDSK